MNKLAIKRIAVEFFYWWYNSPGTNTEQGFEEWAEGPGKDLVEGCLIKDQSGLN